MKIAMLGHKRIPSREGGVEIVVEELALRMVQEGHNVTVYNRKGKHVSTGESNRTGLKKQNYYKGIRIISVPTFEKKSLNAIVYSILATLRAVCGGYDVIHFHAEGPCSMIWLPHFLGIHTVATIHGLDWQRSKWGGFATKFLLFGEKMAVKYADEIIVLSENVQKYFEDTYQRGTVYIPNGINRAQVRQPQLIREQYGLEKNSYILFLARLVPEKGVHYLIEAYKNLHTDKTLVIAGGSSHSSEYVEEVKRLAAEDERILLTGFVQGALLEELYSNAYLYVLPSDVEGMPISLLEAMSYGNCCLVSDIPENVGVIGAKGVSFAKGNVQELMQSLQELLADEQKVTELQKASAEYICEKYPWAAVVQKTLALYRKDEA